jgi:hypothetical protein
MKLHHSVADARVVGLLFSNRSVNPLFSMTTWLQSLTSRMKMVEDQKGNK